MNGDWLRARLRPLLDNFWFVPGLTAIGLGILAVVLLAVDRRSGSGGYSFAYQGGPGAARDVLAVLAGSVITVAGLTFSIMIVTLQLVAAQYTPRALRTFLADRLTQLVAGTFVGVFAYALIVLRSIRDGGPQVGDERVPSLSITVAIALGLVALLLLIAFINHMSQQIQISEITSRVARDTLESVERMYPSRQGEPAGDDAEAVLAAWRERGAPAEVRSPKSGFLRAVGLDPIARVARDYELRVHVVGRPGAFVTRRTPILEVWPPEAARDEGWREPLESSFAFGNERDLQQDVAFGLRQLSDIAMRALSPGVNDPTTAVNCLHHSQEILERLAARDLPDRVRSFGSTRLVVERPAFRDHLRPLAEIGVFAAGQPEVAELVLEVLRGAGDAAAEAGYRDRVDDVVEVAEQLGGPLLEGAAVDENRRRLATRLEEITSLARLPSSAATRQNDGTRPAEARKETLT